MPIKNPAYLWAIAVDVRKATAASNAVTVNAEAFKVTSESLTTAAAAEYALTMTNNKITADSIVLYSVGNGTNTQGTVTAGQARVSAGSCVFSVSNTHASEALNWTITLSGIVINPKGV